MTKLVALVGLSLFASCVSPTVRKLPMYGDCANIAPAGETRCIRSDEVSPDELPAMIPYALVTIENASSAGDCERSVEYVAAKENPDVLYMGQPGTTYAGSVGSAVASGGVAVGFATPVYGHSLQAVCYRLSPVRIGVQCDTDGMVVAIEDASRKSGILEGDHLISIAGSPIKYGQDYAKSPHYHKLLKMKPGEEVTVVWIRPGTGRMEGRVTCLANPPVHLELADARKEREADLIEQQGRGAARRAKSDF